MNYGRRVLLMTAEEDHPVSGGEPDVNPRGGIFGPHGGGGGIYDGTNALNGLGWYFAAETPVPIRLGLNPAEGAQGVGASVPDLPVDTVKEMQRELNLVLAANGYCPVAVDGKAGPDTCAAAVKMGNPLGVNCQMAGITGGTMPNKKPNCGGGGGGLPPAPKCMNTGGVCAADTDCCSQKCDAGKCVYKKIGAGMGGSNTVWIALGLAALGAGAFLLARGKRRH